MQEVIQSPNGLVCATITDNTTKETASKSTNTFLYSLSYQGERILADSPLGLVLRCDGVDQAITPNRYAVVGTYRDQQRSSWRQPFGDRQEIPDNYNALTVVLEERSAKQRRIHVELRAYDEGFALRFIFPGDVWAGSRIVQDQTMFQFPAGCMAYEEHGTEGEYEYSSIDDIKPNCQIPLTVVFPTGTHAAIAEAGVFDHAQMLLSSPSERPDALQCDLRGPMEMTPSFAMPWRVITLGRRPAELLDHNYLILNLNPPSVIEDTSWIKPGKVLREITLSTQGGKACVDFAVKHNLQYVMYDAGWYGPERDESSDATTVNVDVNKAPKDAGPLDLQEVIDYANARGIGIILYVNRVALKRQWKEIIPLYAKWGVKGIKFGFVTVGTQQAMAHIHDAVKLAAAHRLVINIHDEYRPSGMSRTYPNLLTQEGVRGNEHMPTSRHNATLPFTRFTTGAADYTVCYYEPRIKTTHAHQLALSVICLSPLQSLFWYDRPDAFQGEIEVEFFADVPSVWDETRVIHDQIGEHVTIARRKGRHWFIGTITNESPRDIAIPLDFLTPDAPYQACIYIDSESRGSKRTGVWKDELRVDHRTVWTARLDANGGAAIRLSPVL